MDAHIIYHTNVKMEIARLTNHSALPQILAHLDKYYAKMDLAIHLQQTAPILLDVIQDHLLNVLMAHA